MLKEHLKKLIEAKEKKIDGLKERSKTTEDIAELRSINDTIENEVEELNELRSMYAAADEPEDKGGKDDVLKGIGKRDFEKKGEHGKNDPFDTDEYRAAFMDFCKRGTPIPAELRSDAVTTTGDASAVIPTTILNEIVSEMKVYGNLYDEVRKLNIKGGVNVPILSLKPIATWISADTGTSESSDQKIQANTSVVFNYYGLECKIAQSLLTNVTTIDAFQALFVPLAAEAMVKALDIAIMNGTGSDEPTGITVDSRVPARNKITLTADDIASWSAWKQKVFSKMKKAYRDGKFYMSQSTFDGYIDGMTDDNGQPIGRVNYGIDGDERYRFGGKIVDTVEDDVIKAYDDASSGDVIAVFVRPTDYAINSNMEMTVSQWVDQDKNVIKNKVMMTADGKLIDPYGVLIIKKA